MSLPFFSILVPVYNVKRYLDECLESLTSQTFDDYEVVLVDDGSTDGCSSICDAWQTRFPKRIRVVHQENRGLVMARSVGFHAARGSFFVIVDSDDVLRQDALAILHDYFTRYAADMVVYQASLKPDYSVPFRKYPFQDGEVMSVDSNKELRRLIGTTFRMNSLCAKAFSRELAEIERDFTPVSHISEGEDLMFSLPLVDKAQRIVYAEHILYYYRSNPASISNTYHPKLFISVRDTLRIQRVYAEKWDPTGALAEACDCNALRRFYDVIARIGLAALPVKERRRYLLEVISDSDFLRCLGCLPRMDERKVRLTLTLVKHRCFGPLYLYSWLKRERLIPGLLGK